ncbi:hypothetical protein BYT27DRAFT_7222356 [Phlegmacium glaucopus]|nr:hypothetical protein BYT27DRAFT_7222356 [Phlegmacium glaucopus]
MPDCHSSSTPAWDPPPRTPTHLSSPFASTSQITPMEQEVSQNPLIDRRLIGAELNAVANGGSYKDKSLTVSIVEVDGRICIRHIVYRTSNYLEPSWVAPKYPNPTWDNGLLVIIKGDYCGKHNGQVVVILAVVKRMDGVDFLCTCPEDKAQKDYNRLLMTLLHNEAHKLAI